MADDFEGIVDLIAGTEDIKSVLDGLTGFAAASMTSTTGVPIECAVTLHRRKLYGHHRRQQRQGRGA